MTGNRLDNKRVVITGAASGIGRAAAELMVAEGARVLILPHMIDGGGGSIINTVSVAGLTGDTVQCAYGASKAAVIGLTQYIAVQYARNDVRRN